jgi:hypothetical protein
MAGAVVAQRTGDDHCAAGVRVLALVGVAVGIGADDCVEDFWEHGHCPGVLPRGAVKCRHRPTLTGRLLISGCGRGPAVWLTCKSPLGHTRSWTDLRLRCGVMHISHETAVQRRGGSTPHGPHLKAARDARARAALLAHGQAAVHRPDLASDPTGLCGPEANQPGWVDLVRPGDLIVADRNFNTGSSRPATQVLKVLVIGGVIAESMNGLFFRRNCVNFALPAVACATRPQMGVAMSSSTTGSSAGITRTVSAASPDLVDQRSRQPSGRTTALASRFIGSARSLRWVGWPVG